MYGNIIICFIVKCGVSPGGRSEGKMISPNSPERVRFPLSVGLAVPPALTLDPIKMFESTAYVWTERRYGNS